MSGSIRLTRQLATERLRGAANRFRRRVIASGAGHRIRGMDTVAALLIVVFQLFFGWCGENPGKAPPAAPTESASVR